MKALNNSSDCPKCGSEHKSKPFCTYVDGVHCFSCGYTKKFNTEYTIKPTTEKHMIYTPTGPITITTTERFGANITLTKKYPESSTNNFDEFESFIKKYLALFYIGKELVHKYGIRSVDNSVIYPTNNGYQQRWIGRDDRKIITKGEKTPTLLVKEESNKIVLVEDYLSAVRVNEWTNVLCLWGTKLKENDIYSIIFRHNKIIIWLDNDTEKEINSGQEAANTIIKKINHKLNYYHVFHHFKIRNIVTEKDPKYYSPREIEKILKEVL